MYRVRPIVIAALAVVISSIAAVSSAQDKLSNRYIPDDAVAVLFYPIDELLDKPEMDWYPIEILQAQTQQSVGLDPLDVDNLTVVAGMPGPNGPQAGAVIELNKDYSIEDLNSDIFLSDEPWDMDGLSVYSVDTPMGVVLHRVDARTFVVATGSYLRSVIEADDETDSEGKLSGLVGQLKKRPGITLIAVMEPIRPIVDGVLRQYAAKLPKQLQGLANFAGLTEALLINTDFTMMSGSLYASILTADDDSAIEMKKTLDESLDFGIQMFSAQIKQGMGTKQGPVEQATIRYVDRMAEKIRSMDLVNRSGNRIQMSTDANVAVVGVMVGLLLPAVQAAREAARRMSGSNNLKQIGLAMHNHHAAFKQLPDHAIRDEAGKPLLSWRVKILPFIEQMELYQQFHLDEPWDSPHNIKLLPQMPQIYVDPSAPLQPGYTVFQSPVGDQLLFANSGERRFRDVTDGLSNTIMAVETKQEAAVPWTKPQDLTINLDDPKSILGNSHPGGCHVLMADGAVHFVTYSVDTQLLRALLTRAGGEPVGDF